MADDFQGYFADGAKPQHSKQFAQVTESVFGTAKASTQIVVQLHIPLIKRDFYVPPMSTWKAGDYITDWKTSKTSTWFQIMGVTV